MQNGFDDGVSHSSSRCARQNADRAISGRYQARGEPQVRGIQPTTSPPLPSPLSVSLSLRTASVQLRAHNRSLCRVRVSFTGSETGPFHRTHYVYTGTGTVVPARPAGVADASGDKPQAAAGDAVEQRPRPAGKVAVVVVGGWSRSSS